MLLVFAGGRMATKPIVAIVGRPNVGKSTFFNRLIGERSAIVQNEPGTTRDRIYSDTDWGGRVFTIVDTGGFLASASDGEELTEMVRVQAEQAIAEADLILFMIDVTSGLTPPDRDVADILRRTQKPIVLAANKADSFERTNSAVDFYELGMGDPIPISAYHGTGTGDLLDKVVEMLPPQSADEVEEEHDTTTRIAIVGRPNVGKSRLLNAILGADRAIVSDLPGTTRDPVDTRIQWLNNDITLVDTAGIRRRGRIEPGVEQWSVLRTLRAISRSDVVLLLIDAAEGLTAQDEHVISYVLEESKALVIAVNKWDLVEKESNTMQEYTRDLRERLNYVNWAAITFISAKFSQRIPTVMDAAIKAAAERNRRVTTAEINRLMNDAVADHQPPSKPGKWLKFLYATQADTRPPTFIFFVNDAKQVQFGYKRYLENRIRDRFGFKGTPIRLFFRSRHETQ